MEHRCSMRKPYAVDVLLCCRGENVIRGTTKDIGVWGMFVKMEPVTVNVNTIVEAWFRLHKDGWMRSFRAKAMVVHVMATGAGIMFTELEEDLHQALRGLIYDAHQDKDSDAGLFTRLKEGLSTTG